MAKLEIELLAGPETKAALCKLEALVERLEAAACMNLPKAEFEDEKEEAEAEDQDDEDFTAAAPAKKKGKKEKAKSFDDDEETEEVVAEEEWEAEEDVPSSLKKTGETKVKTKAKKITLDDCNDAAKALASSIGGKPGREKVLALMKKHFGTQSVSELDDDQYEEFCSVMKKNMK